MEKITVTQNGSQSPFMSYIYGRLSDRFSFLPADTFIATDGDRTILELCAERRYSFYIRKFTEENIADVIAVGYKYRYFARRLFLPLLSAAERDILLTALVAADLADDRAYVAKRIVGADEYCIDGTYNFRLGELRARWKGIADYIPSEFTGEALDSFLSFLISECDGRVFLKDGRLYDGDYRPLTRSALIGGVSPVREIILSGADSVYCFGAPAPRVRDFLLKYYKEKVVFC